MGSPKGYLCLVLHGHLPFVRHPELPECLEEDWYFEALTEVYLPLLDSFFRLKSEGIPFRIAFSLSPTLLAMMSDPLLISRYDAHLDRLVGLAEAESRRTAGSAEFGPAAEMYLHHFQRCRQQWREAYGRDLIGAFRRLDGDLELFTTAATHGFFPLMEVCPQAVTAQVEAGCQAFEKAIGRRPAGFWLPECGYTGEAANKLAEAGIRYTFVETHGVLHATPRPKFNVYAPVRTPSSVALFGRDPETARQVWSAVEGYPGDFWYRDFYRDIGFDLPDDYLRPYRGHGDLKTATGIKYYRITGKTDQKEPYDPRVARRKAEEHAENFFFNRERQAEHLQGLMSQVPVITSMYDAELFGHWWFEGPQFLEALFRKAHACPDVLQLATPSDALAKLDRIQEVTPHLSTWGWKGYNEVWLQGSNAWIYRHLHQSAWRMSELVQAHPSAQGTLRRALNQALRELFLAQSSDWPFILGQGTSTEYAQRRLERHATAFTRLYEQIRSGAIDEGWVSALENQDSIFPFLDYRVFR